MTKSIKKWEEESRKLNTGSEGSRAEKTGKGQDNPDICNETFWLKIGLQGGKKKDNTKVPKVELRSLGSILNVTRTDKRLLRRMGI